MLPEELLGFDIDIKTIREFKPLSYHLEESYLNDVLIVNDSKSTSAESLRMAIETYLNKNIILIFGGKNKGGDFSFLNEYKLKEKICFGKLSEEIENVELTYKNKILENCVEYAASKSSKGDIILFSCGCASFDLFNDYKERGKKFNELIEKYK